MKRMEDVFRWFGSLSAEMLTEAVRTLIPIIVIVVITFVGKQGIRLFINTAWPR